MKYKEVDWSRFDDRPSEEAYSLWAKARKEKHKSSPNQAAINLMAVHINKLYQSGTDAEEAFSIAASEGWRSIKFQWVMNWIQSDMQGLSDNVVPIKSTRDTPLIEELTDRSWAD